MRVSSVYLRLITNRLFLRGAGGFRALGVSILICLASQCAAAEFSEALIDAATDGNLTDVSRLIDAGHAVKGSDRQGRSPLWYASSVGHAAVGERLIEVGAEVDSQDRFGVSPLVVAVKRGHVDVVRVLLKAGVRVNPGLRAKFIPLHVAVEQNNLSIAFLLLAGGADPLIQQETGDPGTDLVRNAMIRARLRGMTLNAFLFLGTEGDARLTLPIEHFHRNAEWEVRDRDGFVVFRSDIPGPIVPPDLQIVWDRKNVTGEEILPGEYAFSFLFPDSTRKSHRRRAVRYDAMTLFNTAVTGCLMQSRPGYGTAWT